LAKYSFFEKTSNKFNAVFALQTQKTPEFGEDRGIVGRYRRRRA
jgi:hypothetical protein